MEGLGVSRRTLEIGSLRRDGPTFFQVESIVVDRPATGAWTWVLDDEDFSTGLGVELVLVVRIGMEDHASRAALVLTNLECAFEHVPDLREVVVVQRMVRARLELKNSGVGLSRAL